MRLRRTVACILALAAAGVISCRREPRRTASPVEVPAGFSVPGGGPAPARWWTSFGDGQLEALEKRALAGNLNLKVAWDRLAQAEATARKSGAALWPEVTAGGGASRTRSVQRSGAAAMVSTSDVTYSSRFTLNAAASYELDLWGRVRAGKHAATADAAASREDVDAAAMSLSAEVARAWYRLVKTRAELDLLARQAKVNRDFLKLTELRFKQGQGSAVDVLQQRQEVKVTAGATTLARQRGQVLEHQLAVLLGEPPRAPVAGRRRALPALPELPATGLPAELLRRRPDVRAAHLRLAAADRRVAVAVADRFPRLSLSARAETESAKLRDLFDNWLASMAANLLAPVFDAGRRKAEVQRARAASSERLHGYGQTVLDALKEVEDALVRERRGAEYLANIEERLKLARRLVARTRERYANGATDYLPVLIALGALHNLERAELEARLTLIEQRIGLYRALGGSWGLPRPGTGTTSGGGK